jgi:hypothetical protein
MRAYNRLRWFLRFLLVYQTTTNQWKPVYRFSNPSWKPKTDHRGSNQTALTENPGRQPSPFDARSEEPGASVGVTAQQRGPFRQRAYPEGDSPAPAWNGRGTSPSGRVRGKRSGL